ncbi:MAG: methylated-DNA--[protein]-cysteine S-methyltransferase [Planctomycetes bacterium]|nr:methylated-DNA--[protein]-cysteine S-methyltransferase [Planctomycetota bacterium]
MAASSGHFLFDTVLGTVGLAWTARGIDALVLAEGDPENTRRRLLERAPGRTAAGIAPAAMRAAARRIRRHLDGRPDALRDIALDLAAVPAFARRVYTALRCVDPGATVSYGELARRAGRPAAARAVGRAMASNPVPLLVPCHRVLTAGGKAGGFSAPGGAATKERLLWLEGVVLDRRLAPGVRHLLRHDPRLAPVVRRVGPYRPAYGEPGDAFGALVEAILCQQLSTKAAATIAARVRALTPGPRFPQPEELARLPAARLKAAGVSQQKIGYLRDLAARAVSGELDGANLRRLHDEAVIERITRVKGLGRWSAEMFLLFHLGRPDVLPVADLGLRKGIQAVYGLDRLPDRPTVERIGERWRPYRSLGTWYVWAHRNGGER